MIAKGFKAQQQKLAAHAVKIATLEEEVARLTRGKKRKAIPNPNRHFIALCEALIASEAIPKGRDEEPIAGVVESDIEEEDEVSKPLVIIVATYSPQITTRAGRVVIKRRRCE